MTFQFETTSWSVISAARGLDSPAARMALERLCTRYWSPLYVFVRQKGFSRQEAEDLTQEFFAHLLSNDLLFRVDRGLGRFRTFLLTCLENFLRDEWRKRKAAKRGGGTVPLEFDFESAEAHLLAHGQTGTDPRAEFERRWAESLLDNVARRLQEEYRASGRGEVFAFLQGFLGREEAPLNYAEAAEKLGTTENAVRVAVHRLRRRFALLTREEIAQTVENKEDIQEELNHLIAILER